MEESDKAFEDNMSRLSGNMDKLTRAITTGFTLLQQLLLQSEPRAQTVMQQNPYGRPYVQPFMPPHVPMQNNGYSAARPLSMPHIPQDPTGQAMGHNIPDHDGPVPDTEQDTSRSTTPDNAPYSF